MEHRGSLLGSITSPEALRTVQFHQPQALELHNPFPVTAEDLCIFVSGTLLLDHASFILPLGSKTALIGDNGTGKTTFLAKLLQREQWFTISPKAEIEYFSQDSYRFQSEQTVLEYMQEPFYLYLMTQGFSK